MTITAHTPDRFSRRAALKTTFLGASGWALMGGSRGLAVTNNTTLATAGRTLKLGVATYSLVKSSLDEVIAALQTLKITNVSLYKTHCPWNATPEVCAAVAKKIREAGLTLTATGVIHLTNNEHDIRIAFENTIASGAPTMVCSPEVDALPKIDAMIKEYPSLRVAIHNHGPEDKIYPSPYDVWGAIQPYDPRIGICLDVGHAARAGVDPIEAIHRCQSRLYDLHLKDSVAPVGAPHDLPIEVGQGRLDIRGILVALLEINYSNVVAFEYEKVTGDRFAGLQSSVDFVRKTLSSLQA